MSDAIELQKKLQAAVDKGMDDSQPVENPQSDVKIATGLPTSTSADLMVPVARSAWLMSFSLGAAILAAIGWSRFAVVEEVTIGQGQVVPAGKVQLVQNLEGGIISDIGVKVGAKIARGQLLLKIDPTGAGSNVGKNREILAGFSAKITRLTARLNNQQLNYSETFSNKYPLLVGQNQALFTSRTQELTASLSGLDDKTRQRQQEVREVKSRIATLTRALGISDRELALVSKLAKDDIVSEAELLLARAKSNELRGQVEALKLSLPRLAAAQAEISNLKAEKKSSFTAKTLAELNETQIKFAALGQTLAADQDKLKRTEVRSPVDGIVKTLHINTIGQVVKPGADLVEIVPVDESLLVETKIRPQDIAFLRQGQKAVVKLSAYDYALYGSLTGKLETIGADSITNDRGDTYFIVSVRTNESFLRHKGDMLPIKPGMVAQVDILTGEKTIFNYITKPMHRIATEAFRER